jgi:cation transport ATPase
LSLSPPGRKDLGRDKKEGVKSLAKREKMTRVAYFLPRVLALLLIAFMTIFSLDVFGQSQWFLALLIHLIPSFILGILTIIAWKSEKTGGFLFLIVGLVMAYFYHSLFISVPALIIGALFLGREYLSKTRK